MPPSGSSAAPTRFERARQKLHAYLRTIAKEHASPARLFVACVVGGALGSTPFFGLHLPLCIAVARLLRLNRVAVYGAANISIPPIAPFLAAACIEVGSRVLTGHGAAVRAASLRGATLKTVLAMTGDVVAAWLVGAPIVGGLAGAVIGLFVMSFAKREKRAQDPFAIAAEETARRFAGAPRTIRHYVPWKLRLDPVYRAIAGQLPDRATIVDLGTGMGILPILLALLGAHRRAFGVEWDAAKAAAGTAAARELPVEITQGDLRTYALPRCDVVTLVDVLHYFSIDDQRAVLRSAAEALRPGGIVLVRESESDGRAATTRAIERIAVAVGWNRSAQKPHFRPIRELVDDLRALGLACEVVPVAGPLHPGNVLVRASRSASGGPRSGEAC